MVSSPNNSPYIWRNPNDFLTPIRPAQLLRRVLGLESVAPTIEGIDISVYQNPANIDYDALVAGKDFFFVRASDGMSKDPYYDRHVDELAYKRGAIVNTYHHFRDANSGVDQAEFHLGIIGQLLSFQGNLVVANDVETYGGLSKSAREIQVRAFFEEVEPHCRTGMYTSPYFWGLLMPSAASTWINEYDNWVAAWTSASNPTLPVGWLATSVFFWQYGIWNTYPWCLPVPGMLPDVDVDRAYFSSKEAFREWLGIGTPVPPPIPPPVTWPVAAFNCMVVNTTTWWNVRQTPIYPTSKSPVGTVPAGRILTVWEELIDPAGNVWWRIEDDMQSKLTGWVAAVYGGQTRLARLA